MTTTCLIMIIKSGFEYWLAMAERRQRLRLRLWDLPYPEEGEQVSPEREAA